MAMGRREIAYVLEFWCHSLENYYGTSCQKQTLGLLVDQTLIRYALCCLRNCIKSQQEMVTNFMANQFGDQSYSFKMAVLKGVFIGLGFISTKRKTIT